MTEKALAEEIAFYEEHFEEYRRKYAGRYVLIHGPKLIGVYEEELAADYDGYRQVWRTGTEDHGYLVLKAGEPAVSIVAMPIVTKTLSPTPRTSPACPRSRAAAPSTRSPGWRPRRRGSPRPR